MQSEAYNREGEFGVNQQHLARDPLPNRLELPLGFAVDNSASPKKKPSCIEERWCFSGVAGLTLYEGRCSERLCGAWGRAVEERDTQGTNIAQFLNSG